MAGSPSSQLASAIDISNLQEYIPTYYPFNLPVVAVPSALHSDVDFSTALDVDHRATSSYIQQQQTSPSGSPDANSPSCDSSSDDTLVARKAKGSRRARGPNYIRRPRNAFMIYRSELRIPDSVEHDHRNISRIAGHHWRNMTDAEKQGWRDRAAEEKVVHAQKYPNYRFTPTSRTDKPLKRNVKRNGVTELARCRRVAELLLAGKQGDDLEIAVKEIDSTVATCEAGSSAPQGSANINYGEQVVPSEQEDTDAGCLSSVPAFRSPLLPPMDEMLLEEVLTELLEPQSFPSHIYGPLLPQSYLPVFQQPIYQNSWPVDQSAIFSAPPVFPAFGQHQFPMDPATTASLPQMFSPTNSLGMFYPASFENVPHSIPNEQWNPNSWPVMTNTNTNNFFVPFPCGPSGNFQC